MQAVGGHIPFGFLQGTNVLVHGEVKATGLIEVVVFHLLRVKVYVSAVIGCRKRDVRRVCRIQEEVSRVGHKGSGIQGEVVGVELGQSKTQLTVGLIAIRRQCCLSREISVAIHADRLVNGLSSQFRKTDIPLQPQGISRSHRESSTVVTRHHFELVGDGCDGVQIEHKLIRLEGRSLIVELALAEETASRKEDFVVESSQVTIQRIGCRLVLPYLMDEAQREVFHDHQRLLDVGHDAARHQLAIETHFPHREVI